MIDVDEHLDVHDPRFFGLTQAAERGLGPVERIVRGEWVWGWARGDDERWPCFLTRREALSWMDDRLTRCAVFA